MLQVICVQVVVCSDMDLLYQYMLVALHSVVGYICVGSTGQ